MVFPLRIGLFPYLNIQPLRYGLSEEEGIELVIDLPSRIADRFRDGTLDLAMVPSFEAATLQAPIVDSICISSDGPVETVILHHRKPLPEVRTIAFDEASRTSAALSRILIAQASGQAPVGRPFSPGERLFEDTDAILVIGDPAFRFQRDGYDRLDLGQAWREREALPFVFAVMVKGPRAKEGGLAERLREATRRGLNAAPLIARSYNSGVDAARAERYMKTVIGYDLGAREKEGLARFYRLAEANGLLAPMKELIFDAL